MGYIVEMLLVCLGVSFDVLALSICQGAVLPKLDYKQITRVALIFCLTQTVGGVLGALLSLIPLIRDNSGLGQSVGECGSIVILLFISVFLLYKGWRNEEVLERRCEIDFKKVRLSALLASVDTLFAGVSVAMWKASIWGYALGIFVVTALAVYLGVYIGYRLGYEPKKPAYTIGSAVLIIAAVDIFIRLLTR